MENGKTNYGIRKATISLPTKDLLVVPHRGSDLIVNHPAFGPGAYWGGDMREDDYFYHSPEFSNISFRDPTTSESISVEAYDPEVTRGLKRLFLGEIITGPEGVYANHPEDLRRTTITGDQNLDQTDVFRGVLFPYLSKMERIDGIWLLPNGLIERVRDFGFAPFDTFRYGQQDLETFIGEGLARLLEHTNGSADSFREIARKIFPKGCNIKVEGFEPKTNSDWKYHSSIANIYVAGNSLIINGSIGYCSNREHERGYLYGVLENTDSNA